MLNSQLKRVMRSIGKKPASAPRGPRPLEGVLDTVDDGLVTGWAYNPNNPSDKVLLEVTYKNETTEVIANAFRADLQAAGKGDGHHAFSVAVKADPVELGPVSVRILATGQHLQGSPRQTGILDVLASAADSIVREALASQLALVRAKYVQKGN